MTQVMSPDSSYGRYDTPTPTDNMMGSVHTEREPELHIVTWPAQLARRATFTFLSAHVSPNENSALACSFLAELLSGHGSPVRRAHTFPRTFHPIDVTDARIALRKKRVASPPAKLVHAMMPQCTARVWRIAFSIVSRSDESARLERAVALKKRKHHRKSAERRPAARGQK
ncbi:unnamed protein product, partial [Iphiclides podalirius]